MVDVAALIADLVAAGVPAELVGRTAAALAEREPVLIPDEQAERRRAADRDRKRAVRGIPQTSAESADTVSPKKEIPPTPPKEKTTPSTEPNGSGVVVRRANDLDEFKAELHDLDAQRLDAIVKHRRSKRGQLTGLSAQLFRRDAGACGLSLADAVDTCISRNWITVKPEFLAGRQLPRATAPPKPAERSVGDALREMAAGTWNSPGTQDDPPTIETSFHR